MGALLHKRTGRFELPNHKLFFPALQSTQQDRHSPALRAHLERRRESRLEVRLEGHRHLGPVHQNFGLHFEQSFNKRKLSWLLTISTCRECAPRRHKGRQLDHLGLLGLAAADGLVLEDEGVLDGLVEILAWEKQSQHFAQQLPSGFRCVGCPVNLLTFNSVVCLETTE